MDASPIFNGTALTYSVIGAGVVIDPATGELSISIAALRAGVEVTVTAANSGGTAISRFRVAIAPAEELPVAPASLVPPTLVGSGTIGVQIMVEPGSWSGDPAPDLGFVWCQDRAPIAGATGLVYVPAAADDHTDITCRVTATNETGSAEAVTPALRIAHAAPAGTSGLADIVFNQDSGTQTVAAAQAFTGAALVFGVTGAGATVDPATGVVSIPTGAALTNEPVTVTATNSGGQASASFRVTVIAALPAFPPAILAAQWSAVEVRDAAPAGRRRITLNAGIVVPAGFELRLYSGTVAGGQAALSNRIMAPGEIFTTVGSLSVGATCHNRLYWRRIADGAWAPASANVISFPILGLEPVAPLPVAPVLVAAPLLAGAGRIGTEVTVDPGSWGGDPAPQFAFAWCRDGIAVGGAAGRAYTPGPGDDRAALTCRVTATNAAGSRTAETAALTITYAPPTSAGGLPDEVFDQGSGPHTVTAAEIFAGAGLVFDVTGAGATVDPATGVVSIPTGAVLAGELVTITAANSGGAASASFRVTVVAALPAFPPSIPAALWSAVEVRDAAPAGRRRITLNAGIVVPAGFELRLYSGTVAGGQAALSNRIMAPGEIFTTVGSLSVGATCHNRLYWRRIADGSWAPASANVISFPILGLAAPLPVPPVPIADATVSTAAAVRSQVQAWIADASRTQPKVVAIDTSVASGGINLSGLNNAGKPRITIRASGTYSGTDAASTACSVVVNGKLNITGSSNLAVYGMQVRNNADKVVDIDNATDILLDRILIEGSTPNANPISSPNYPFNPSGSTRCTLRNSVIRRGVNPMAILHNVDLTIQNVVLDQGAHDSIKILGVWSGGGLFDVWGARALHSAAGTDFHEDFCQVGSGGTVALQNWSMVGCAAAVTDEWWEGGAAGAHQFCHIKHNVASQAITLTNVAFAQNIALVNGHGINMDGIVNQTNVVGEFNLFLKAGNNTNNITCEPATSRQNFGTHPTSTTWLGTNSTHLTHGSNISPDFSQQTSHFVNGIPFQNAAGTLKSPPGMLKDLEPKMTSPLHWNFGGAKAGPYLKLRGLFDLTYRRSLPLNPVPGDIGWPVAPVWEERWNANGGITTTWIGRYDADGRNG